MIRYIIGCGPNGAAVHDLIPKDAPVIVLNAAITLVTSLGLTNFDWMVSDNQAVETTWFRTGCFKFQTRLWGSGQVAERTKVAHEFQENPWMAFKSFWETDKTLDVKPKRGGVLRGGGTVAGCALHRCYWRNEDPILVGIDMDGGNAVSGHEYEPGHWDKKIRLLNALCECYIPQTRTLSETKLEVEPL